LNALDRSASDDAAAVASGGFILDAVDFSAPFDESEYDDAEVEEGSAEGGVAAGGQWWDSLGDTKDGDDDDDDDAGGSDLKEAAWDVGMGGTRANPKASGKGASTLPRALKRRPVPLVAILGRPNVGKSMLANRISGKHNRGAIVHDEVGVTRDRTYLRSEWCGATFDVVDTGGLVFDDDTTSLFLEQIRQQAAIALSEATCAVLVVDGQAGRQPLDEQVAAFLRREWSSKIPIVVAVNKCESQVTGDLNAADFWSLGLGAPLPVSGIHGSGVAELLDELAPHLYKVKAVAAFE
jgi:small GTP-binding protein